MGENESELVPTGAVRVSKWVMKCAICGGQISTFQVIDHHATSVQNQGLREDCLKIS